MAPVDITGIVNTAIGQLPSILSLIRDRHAAANPGAPRLTDEDVKVALRAAVSSSLAKDDELEADIHRRNPPPENAKT